VLEPLAASGVVLLLDQWTKMTVQRRATDYCIAWGPVLRIRCLTQQKPMYSCACGRALLVLVWLMALVSAIALHRSGILFQSRDAACALGLAFGGAAGNLVDILRLRSIIDFIDLRWWPVFNLADLAIVGGLTIAFWSHC
jgi:signal peptidase II